MFKVVFDLGLNVFGVIKSAVTWLAQGLVSPGVEAMVHEVAVVADGHRSEKDGLFVRLEDADATDLVLVEIVDGVV